VIPISGCTGIRMAYM